MIPDPAEITDHRHRMTTDELVVRVDRNTESWVRAEGRLTAVETRLLGLEGVMQRSIESLSTIAASTSRTSEILDQMHQEAIERRRAEDGDRRDKREWLQNKMDDIWLIMRQPASILAAAFAGWVIYSYFSTPDVPRPTIMIEGREVGWDEEHQLPGPFYSPGDVHPSFRTAEAAEEIK